MKLNKIGYRSLKWPRLYLRVIKLCIFAIPIILVASSRYKFKACEDVGRLLRIWMRIRRFLRQSRYLIGIYRNEFLNKDFIDSKCVTVNYIDYRPIASSLDGIVAFAWICEKMKINIKFQHPTHMIWRHFENDIIINTTDKLGHRVKSIPQNFFSDGIAYFGIFFVSSEYGYKVLSKLSVKEGLKESANRWFAKHIKRDWVAVHYRGTDIAAGARAGTGYIRRYSIELDPYITYLKGVLDNQRNIFACSDQAQFIDKMRLAFPGRVFARDIKRSYDDDPIHRHGVAFGSPGQEVDNFDQEKDAWIDLLILAKAELIYTTGSGFVDAVRYFSPSIKIVSMDGRTIGRGRNNAPMPRRDLYERLRRR